MENQTRLFTEEQGTHLALLPLKNVVILPKSIIPIIVGRHLLFKQLNLHLKHNQSIFITAKKIRKD